MAQEHSKALLKNPLGARMRGRGTDTCIQVRKGQRLPEWRLKPRTLPGLSPTPGQRAGNRVSFTFGTTRLSSLPLQLPSSAQLSSALLSVEMARGLEDLSLRHWERPTAGAGGGGDCGGLVF